MATWQILLVPLIIALVVFAGWSIFYSGSNVLSSVGWLTLALVGYGSYVLGSFILYSVAAIWDTRAN